MSYVPLDLDSLYGALLQRYDCSSRFLEGESPIIAEYLWALTQESLFLGLLPGKAQNSLLSYRD